MQVRQGCEISCKNPMVSTTVLNAIIPIETVLTSNDISKRIIWILSTPANIAIVFSKLDEDTSDTFDLIILEWIIVSLDYLQTELWKQGFLFWKNSSLNAGKDVINAKLVGTKGLENAMWSGMSKPNTWNASSNVHFANERPLPVEDIVNILEFANIDVDKKKLKYKSFLLNFWSFDEKLNSVRANFLDNFS